jgi:hypothetical protein
MKKIFALAAILVVGSANASELKFGDLNYFLKDGQINAGLDWVVNNETTRSGKTDDNEIDAYFYNAHLGYALNDDLNLTLALSYVFDGQTEENAGASADDAGLQNPKLGANYRLMKQAAAGFNLDLGAVATISIADREVSSSTRDGNNFNPILSNYADPRSSLELNARLGNKWNEANEFYFLAGYIYNLDGDYKQLGGNKVDMDSSMDLKLGAFYQYRPVNEFMMTLGLTGSRYGEIDGKDGSSSFTMTDHIDYKFNFDAKYLINESLIAKFSFAQDKRNNYEVERSTSDLKLDKRNATQYGLGIDYLF